MDSSFSCDTDSTYQTISDPKAIEEIPDTSFSSSDRRSITDGSPSATKSEVSLVIKNPDDNLVTNIVNQLVTAKVDFKVLQGSSL